MSLPEDFEDDGGNGFIRFAGPCIADRARRRRGGG
jgi:hypothetical protein